MANKFGCKRYLNKIGVLIAQLGTPKAPTAKELRPYLREFLSDKRVIEKSRLVWLPILHGIVLRTRPKRSAKLYQRIWQKEGSPLMIYTKRQTESLKRDLASIDNTIEVEFGMRYGEHKLESSIDKLISAGCSKILLFPMYPQYSATTTASIYDSVFKHLLKRRVIPTLSVVQPYYRNIKYIKALADNYNEQLRKSEFKPEKLVLSYHGIPESYVKKGDIYCCQSIETTKLLSMYLDFPKADIIHTYQSRFGKDPWLRPYTDFTLEKLAEEGIKKIAVAAPGFISDCLETLDELGNEGKELFFENGGNDYLLLSCLNDSSHWLNAMREMVMSEISPWLESGSDLESQEIKSEAIQCMVGS